MAQISAYYFGPASVSLQFDCVADVDRLADALGLDTDDGEGELYQRKHGAMTPGVMFISAYTRRVQP